MQFLHNKKQVFSQMRKNQPLYSNTTNCYFVIGGPASGKTTWCNTYCKTHTDNEHVFLHIPVGELLKKEIESGSEIGQDIFHCMRNSIIVCDKTTFSVMMKEIERLIKIHKNKNITLLLDGYPRNKQNKEYFEQHKPNYLRVSKVIYIHCDTQTMIQRIEKRKEEFQRFDDKLIHDRLKAFELYTLPLINDFDPKILEKIN
jgi:adenylate kinase family enzyme